MQVYDKLSEVNTNHEELTLGWVTKKISLTGFYGYTDNRYNVHQPQEALVRAKDGEYLFGADRHGKNKANYNTTELNFDWQLSKQHEVGIRWEGLWLNGGRSEKQQQYYRYPTPTGEDTNSEMKLSEADGEMKYYDAERNYGIQKITIPRRLLTCNIRVKLADGAGGQASDTSISHPDTPICRRNLPTIWSAITTSGFHRSVSLSTNHRGITRSASELPPPDLLSVSSVGTSTISRAFSIRSAIRSCSLSTPIV